MQLAVLGLNHKTAPVDIREKFSINQESVVDGLQHIDDYGAILEAVILSTCNRSEIYAVLDDGDDGKAHDESNYQGVALFIGHAESVAPQV